MQYNQPLLNLPDTPDTFNRPCAEQNPAQISFPQRSRLSRSLKPAPSKILSHAALPSPSNPVFAGHKKALTIGINYFDFEGSELYGCINDSNKIKKFLICSLGYKDENIVQLIDDPKYPRSKPTKAAILEAMQWLVDDAKPGDSFFFHYSGYGGQTEDLNGDEADGLDEVIYPVDHELNGHIVDDDMYAIMVRPLPPGCRLTAIFDSSHSGTALDLPYVYSTKGIIDEPDLSAGDSMIKLADVTSWSACKDSEDADDTFGDQDMGAMSYAFMEALDQQPKQSYQELLNNIRKILRNGKSKQKPQLSSSRPLDMTALFFA